MMNTNPTKLTTGVVRLSYCHLTSPHQRAGSTEPPRYSATLLIPKSDITTKAAIDAAIEAAAQAGTAKVWSGQRPPRVAVPVHDGDGVRPSDGAPFGEECRGHWVMTASSKEQPGIVDGQIQKIIDPLQIYSGIYAHVSINLFAYYNQGKKGVGCGLINVQKVADGEPLSSMRSAPEQDFQPVGASAQPMHASAPQQPAYAPQQPAYVPQPAYQPQAYQPAYAPQQPAPTPPYGAPAGPQQYYPQNRDPLTGLPT